jgi:hypothetical protein
LGLGHVLKFVHEDHECSADCLCRRTGALQQILQVVFEVSVVGQPRLAFIVQADLNVLVDELQAFGEARQGTQASHGQVLGVLLLAQAQQRHAQLRGQQGGQRAVLRSFDADGVHARGLCVVAHAVQQHRLSDAAQADHQDAPRGLPSAGALYSNANGFSKVIATSEFRRRGAGAGRKGVSDCIHA